MNNESNEESHRNSEKNLDQSAKERAARERVNEKRGKWYLRAILFFSILAASMTGYDVVKENKDFNRILDQQTRVETLLDRNNKETKRDELNRLRGESGLIRAHLQKEPKDNTDQDIIQERIMKAATDSINLGHKILDNSDLEAKKSEAAKKKLRDLEEDLAKFTLLKYKKRPIEELIEMVDKSDGLLDLLREYLGIFSAKREAVSSEFG